MGTTLGAETWHVGRNAVDCTVDCMACHVMVDVPVHGHGHVRQVACRLFEHGRSRSICGPRKLLSNKPSRVSAQRGRASQRARGGDTGTTIALGLDRQRVLCSKENNIASKCQTALPRGRYATGLWLVLHRPQTTRWWGRLTCAGVAISTLAFKLD